MAHPSSIPLSIVVAGLLPALVHTARHHVQVQIHTKGLVQSSSNQTAREYLAGPCGTGVEFIVEIDYSKVVPTELLPEFTRSYSMETYLGVNAPGQLVLCTSSPEDKTKILEYEEPELIEFLKTVFRFPPNLDVDTANWNGCPPWSGDCISVKMKRKPVEPAMMQTNVSGRSGNIAHGTNMHAVYTAVEKTEKQLLAKVKRKELNVDFHMGAQQAIPDNWNDHFLSIVPIGKTSDSGDQWQVTTFYWAHAVAHIWTWPRTASSSGKLPESPEWGLAGTPKWATLEKKDGKWNPVYATDDHIPVVAVGICDGDLEGKHTGQGSGTVGSEMGCPAMTITDIYVDTSLKKDIETKLDGQLAVHSFHDLNPQS